MRWTRVFLYKWWLIQEFSCSIRCAVWWDELTHVSSLNGRKWRRSGSLRWVLNSEVGDYLLWSLRFNCSECSWQSAYAFAHDRLTASQVYREESAKRRRGHKIFFRDFLTGFWNVPCLSPASILSNKVDSHISTLTCQPSYVWFNGNKRRVSTSLLQPVGIPIF